MIKQYLKVKFLFLIMFQHMVLRLFISRRVNEFNILFQAIPKKHVSYRFKVATNDKINFRGKLSIIRCDKYIYSKLIFIFIGFLVYRSCIKLFLWFKSKLYHF